VDAQGRAAVETVARLRGAISAKEIQVGAMKGYAAPSNPDLQRAEKELSSMRQELSRLESGTPGSENVDGGDVKGMRHIRLMREVKYNEALFEALAKQYELARVEEAREAPLVQVLDRATPPEKKSGPKRAQIVLLATLGGFVAAVLAAFGRNALQAARQDSAHQGRMDSLRAAWSRRKS
jgi:tyrosine-protein kinase Etk/Wzc